MITLVDYGLGNVLAFANMYKRMNIPVSIAHNADELSKATKIILPGVGAFDYAMTRLDVSGMRITLDTLVLERRIPVLGICVGMQILARTSEEGKLSGLGWVKGRVRKLDASKLNQSTHLPHMGWNDVSPIVDSGLFKGLSTGARFYFLHSYYFECDDPSTVLATSEYGERFCCALKEDNVYGVQCHPEKSHHFGSMLLKNFAEV